MSHPAYQWRDMLYCDKHIVPTLVTVAPYDAWPDAKRQPGDLDTEDELDELAQENGINRSKALECVARDFPVRLSHTPEPPSFCCVCLSWFS